MSQRLIALESHSAPEVGGKSHGFQLSCQSVGILQAGTEGLATVFSSVVGEAVYGAISHHAFVTDITVGIGTVAAVLYVALAKINGLYRLPALLKPGRYLRRIFMACSVMMLAVTTILFLLKTEPAFSRGAWLCFAPIMLASCIGIRLSSAHVISGLLERDAIVGRRAFLVGEAEELLRINSSYLLHQFGLREVGRVSLDRPRMGNLTLDPDRIAGALDQARQSRAREFIVVAKWDSTERLKAIEEGFRVSPMPVRLLPNHVFRSVVHRHGPHENCAVHLIDLQRSPMTLSELATKRSLDVVCALLAIVLLLPVFLITAMAIKIDTRGPVIFRQRRNGFNQDEFVIYKFRTMTVMEDDEKVIQAKKGDKRITRVGQFLRRSSVDELPQLFNVLRGDMSLVGPRPHALAHDREYSALIGDYYRRHHVKPGITGWAQVHGFRGETARTEQMRRRIDLDIWYINNWSLLTDIRILARTCTSLLAHEAY